MISVALLLPLTQLLLRVTTARVAVSVPPVPNEPLCFQHHVLGALNNAETAPSALLADFACVKSYASRLGKQQFEQPEQLTRGVVYAGGGRYQVANIVIGVTYIRTKLHSKLPIEIIFHGVSEMPRPLAQLLLDPALQPLAIINAAVLPYPSHHRPVNILGFAAKVWALYAATSFDEVLLLDADSYPLQQPEAYFEAEPYREHGNMFFPDFWHNVFTAEPEIFKIFGTEPPYLRDPAFREAESGQLLINRRRHAVALEWLWYLNAHHPYVYKQMYGDKDTYRLAFYLAGELASYAQSPVWNGAVLKHEGGGRCGNSSAYEYVMVGQVQYGWDGSPWFVHQMKFYPPARVHERMSWDRPDWVLGPTSDAQGRRLMKEACFGLNATEADADAHRQCTRDRPAMASPSVLNITGVCGWDAAWKARNNSASTPLPVFPVAWLPDLQAGLAGVGDVYRSLRPKIRHSFLHSSFISLNSKRRAHNDATKRGSVWFEPGHAARQKIAALHQLT